MKLLYKPFDIIAGILAVRAAGAIFKRIWKLVAYEEDKPSHQGRSQLRGRACCHSTLSFREIHQHSAAQSWPKRRQDAWLYHAVLLPGDLKKTEQIKVFFSLRR
jgi:uncharacterized membrane protein YraQ (UPF0718 family)